MHVNLVDIQYLYRFRNYETVICSVYRSGGEARGWGQGWLGVHCALYPGQAASSRRKVSQCC